MRIRIAGLVAASLLLALGGALIGVLVRQTVTDETILDAIRANDVALMQSYLSQGGSPDRTIDVYGRTMSVLEAAVVGRSDEISLMLVDAGADVSASGVTLPLVALTGLTRTLDRLLSTQPELAESGRSGIVQAAFYGNYDAVNVYLRAASTNFDESWAVELKQAAGAAMFVGYDDIARRLLESGADVREILHTASRFSSPGMIRYLLSRGADPTEELVLPPDDYSVERAPIEFAWKRLRETESFREWLASDPALPFRTEFSFMSNEDVFYILFELRDAGGTLADVNLTDVARDGLGELARIDDIEARLVEAARIGYYEVAEQILTESGVALGEASLRAAVITALANDHDDIARLLLERGAPATGGPLHVAAAASSPGMVQYILSLGGSVSEQYRGRVPLEFWLEQSATQDESAILRRLISAGAEACWLLDRESELPEWTLDPLRNAAPHCWDS